MYGQVCGKVIRRKTQSGESWNFQIVKNRRNPCSGYAENIIIWNFGTVKNTDVATKAKAFWKYVDSVVKQLADSGKIYRNCRSEIEGKFEKYIPRPVATAAVSVPAAKPTIDSNVADRLRARLKDFV